MSVSAVKTKSGVRFRARLCISGKFISLGQYATRAEAESVVKAARAAAKETNRRSLRWWGEIWLNERDSDPHYRGVAKERSKWDRHVVGFAHFADWPLKKIKRRDVVAWVKRLQKREAVTVKVIGGEKVLAPTGRRLARSTCKQALALLKRALNEAADMGYVDQCVALGVRVPKVASSQEKWTFLSTLEIKRLLGLKLRDDQRAILSVAIYAGLRAGELWGLRWGDVRLGAQPQLTVRHSYRGPTKSGLIRRVPLLAPALDGLRRWQQLQPGVAHALVFPAHGGGCHSKGYNAGWSRLVRLAEFGRRVRFHDLRHTFASHLVMGSWGHPWRLEEVRQMLGHSTIQVTERYAHLAPDSLHKLAAKTNHQTDVGLTLDIFEVDR